MIKILFSLLYLLHTDFVHVFAFPDQGKWDLEFNESNGGVSVRKSLFRETKIIIQVFCVSQEKNNTISVEWAVSSIACWDTGTPDSRQYTDNVVKNRTVGTKKTICECSEDSGFCDLPASISTQNDDTRPHSNPKLPVPPEEENYGREKRSDDKVQTQVQVEDDGKAHGKEQDSQTLLNIHTKAKSHPVFITQEDSYYTIMLKMNANKAGSSFNAKVHIEMAGTHGYLSASDWPLLPFYGAMCLVYLVMGLAWLIVSFLQWRDLLRIQFWIGGVILLGMLEKAMFYAEYQSINTTGQSVPAAVLVAELVSCGKRTLARMLVIIVSLGFGIVKPRLGALLHRVVGTGILYFVLAASAAYIQIYQPKNDPANPRMLANIPVAVLDSAICWWIFTSLVQTTRTLRLRRNLVKLNLYRHFTTTLMFAVFSSIVFMVYSMRFHHFTLCATKWNDLWIDEAYWKLLFSVILLVIMILWRPTNNNQRYAFTPLLDAPEDDDDDDEEEQFVNNAYGVKMRAPTSGTSSPKQKLSTNSAEDDLKWVEENIPSSLADTALPILDSDEEIMNTRFEISKMQ